MSHVSVPSWLLLLPQLPPQPSSLRVRVWRRLQQLGAVALKNAAYVLPDSDAALEDFTWLRQEIMDAGGQALLLRAQALELTDAAVEQLFREEREADYRKLTEEIGSFVDMLQQAQELDPGELSAAERGLRQLAQRQEAIRSIDFFPGDAGAAAQEALAAAREALEFWRGRGSRAEPSRLESATATQPVGSGRLWVTRAGVYVDRIACGWMIGRFVDPRARFEFVAPGQELPPESVPFDMAGVELGHHGARCSAEVIAARFRPEDRALRAVAEVVHDLDLKDEGFGRPEAPGLKRVLDGICATTANDEERIRMAAPLFDALYAGFV